MEMKKCRNPFLKRRNPMAEITKEVSVRTTKSKQAAMKKKTKTKWALKKPTLSI
jgi:hypothetical protein